MRNVCQNCEDRYVGCHSHCDLYLDAKQEYDQERERRKRYNECEQYHISRVVKRMNYRSNKRKKQADYSVFRKRK